MIATSFPGFFDLIGALGGEIDARERALRFVPPLAARPSRPSSYPLLSLRGGRGGCRRRSAIASPAKLRGRGRRGRHSRAAAQMSPPPGCLPPKPGSSGKRRPGWSGHRCSRTPGRAARIAPGRPFGRDHAPRGLRASAAVHFDDQSRFDAEEVHEEGSPGTWRFHFQPPAAGAERIPPGALSLRRVWSAPRARVRRRGGWHAPYGGWSFAEHLCKPEACAALPVPPSAARGEESE